jgi:hypothetical protein
MEETSGSATLVESAPEIEAQGMTTTLPRAEVEEALRSEDGPIELFLDVLRPTDDEARTIRVAWDHDDLERILEASSGETVTLAFDRQELERAFDDVEGHGLRERALVLSVAVATAAAGASAAGAAVDSGLGVGGGTSGAAADVAGYQRAMPSDYGPGGAVGAAGEESPAEVTGGATTTPSMEGYVRAMPSDYGPGGAVGAAGDQSPAEVTGGAGQRSRRSIRRRGPCGSHRSRRTAGVRPWTDGLPQLPGATADAATKRRGDGNQHPRTGTRRCDSRRNRPVDHRGRIRGEGPAPTYRAARLTTKADESGVAAISCGAALDLGKNSRDGTSPRG